MFTKVQRKELNDLSMSVFGSSSKWQKLVDDPNFRIPDEKQVVTSKKKYVKTPKGTMLLQTAKDRGLVAKDHDVPFDTSYVTVIPTFSDIKKHLEFMLEERSMSVLQHDELCSLMADKYVNNNITHVVSLETEEKDVQAVDELLALIPEDKRETFTAMVKTPSQHGIKLNALQFLGDVVFVCKNGEKSKELVAELMSDARTLWDKMRVKLQRQDFIKKKTEIGGQFNSQRSARRFAQKAK